MKPKIVIVGSSGKLGTKLLNFTHKNFISVYAITCFNNQKKILHQENKYQVRKSFTLSKDNDQKNFFKLLETNIQIIYFLDYGSLSLKYVSHFLKFNTNSIIAIANKEMIIAGGKLLQKDIKMSNNFFIPLDSEHFSLLNSNINNSNIHNIYITASGGPLYFNKKINLSNVPYKKVLSHPKWIMGNNNMIDSSNFINKILEIFELSYIFDIPLNKINFLISREAFVHSIVHYQDNTLSLNCFTSDMLITMIKPLTYYYNLKPLKITQNYLDHNNLKIEKPNDKRFKIFKYKKQLMKLSHSEQIKLMIVNNSAHKLYLSNELKYNNIISYIMNEIKKKPDKISLHSYKSILTYISLMNDTYKTNV
tara:strand:+ start:946 stop:2037 length:1092 start_codon:yes stop_codon:yes gene_type:complete